MGTTIQAITQAIQHGELQAFGFALPRLAPNWSPDGTPGSFTVDEAAMTITASGHWAAPLDMGFSVIDPTQSRPIPVTLVKADGTIENTGGVLLTLFDQPWLRLNRLYAQVLEITAVNRPEQGRGLPFRPAPRYIFFPGQTMQFRSGLAEAWADLNFAGPARFYDGDGLPIDPVAVMAAFAAILVKFPLLQAVDLTAQPLNPLPLNGHLSSLAPSKKNRLRLSRPDGSAYSGQHLTGATAFAADSGIFDLSGTSVALDAVSDSFSQNDHDRLVFGPSNNGRLTSSFTPPALPPGITLARDFYSLRVVQLKQYLAGEWPGSDKDPATGVQRRPAVRINENVTFLTDGNDLLGAINTALPGGSDPTLAVAQAVDGAFAIPPSIGVNAHWPNFPPGVPSDPSAALSIGLKAQVQGTLTANWLKADPGDFEKADVVLGFQQLPPNAWVRIFPRKFLPNAIQVRGDGQGRLVPAGGTLAVVLMDPFSLRDPHFPSPTDVIVPPKANLIFDMVVVLPNGKSRIYGEMSVKVGPAPATLPTFSAGTNPSGTVIFSGVSKAGILGLGTPSSAPLPTTLAGWARLLSGETQPRDASRLPTMARRELLVAGSQAGVWTGVISAGRIARETVSASPRLGEPGGLGGRETSFTGAVSHGGILAYDIARHAFRRSKDVISRAIELADSKWSVPDESAAVGIGQNPGSNNGTFAAAVLQTIAPFCETPELFAAWAAGVNVNPAIQFVIDHIIPDSLPLRPKVVNALHGLQANPAAPEPAVEADAEHRIAVEIEREITSVFFGRRDAQWALQSAIRAARHLIYIETPGFCSTAVWPPKTPATPDDPPKLPDYAADLIITIKAQLTARPGLRVILCVPKYPDFSPGYEGMAAFEVLDRLTIVKGKTGDKPVAPLPSSQAVVFHPVGFPGRFSRVETNVVVVDDVWAMIGGATVRRRGLTFDGSSDLVVTDTLLENGRSAAIRDFRRGIMANRLGIKADSAQPSFVALSEASTAFRLVSDNLAAGGLGDIAPIWDGMTPGVDPTTPLTADQANPEGRELDFVTASVIAAFGVASGL